ncbi:MAG: hypothetical protein Q8T13_02940 [Acidobacteriota bacterium]|nr:hypothetical protein [Acidobacteriota bacterium]
MTTNAPHKTPGAATDSLSRTGNGHDKSGVMSGIQETVAQRVDQEKKRAAQGIGSIADVIHQAGDGLREQNEGLATLVEGASTQLRQFAEHIRTRGAGDLVEDVAVFGRRRPALFIGGALLLGLGLARFLKSSAPTSRQPYQDRAGAAFGDAGQY